MRMKMVGCAKLMILKNDEGGNEAANLFGLSRGKMPELGNMNDF
jgi:hypothetical protein